MTSPAMIDQVEVFGFRAAIRGCRNAMESWDKSDSYYCGYDECQSNETFCGSTDEAWHVGLKDKELMVKLIKSHHNSEMKFLRMIWVWCDITIPVNVWNEVDTYKVATTRQSCSTMHKLGTRNLTTDDFADGDVSEDQLVRINALAAELRQYTGAERNRCLIKIRRALTWGYLQKATYNFNYATALTMWHDRHNHRLPEWSDSSGGICAFINRLPLMSEFIEASQK